MSIESLRADPRFQQYSPEEQKELVQQYVREEQDRNAAERRPPSDEPSSSGGTVSIPPGGGVRPVGPTPPVPVASTGRGPLGILPNQIQPPRQTGGWLETFNRPFHEAMEGPTFAETYLPEGLMTKAVTGLERGVRLATAPLVGAGNVLEKGVEQLPRVWGGTPESNPVSRVSADVPSLVAQGYVPAGKGPTVSPRAAKAVTLAREAEDVGIPLTAAEATLSPTLRHTEAIVESLPIGGGGIRKYKGRQAEATEAAARGVGERRGESRSAMAAGEPVTEVATREVQRAKAAEELRQATRAQQAGDVGERPIRAAVEGLGPKEETADWMQGVKAHLETGEKAARQEASRLYDRATAMAGDAPVINLQHVADQASQIAKQEAKLGALAQQPTGKVAGSLENLALQFTEQYGLKELRSVDLETANLLDQRLTAMIDAARGDATTRQLRQLRDAVRKDIDAFAADAPGDAGQALREAREFYRTRVGEPFGEDSAIRTIRDSTAVSQVDKLLFDPKAAERITQVKTELLRVDPAAWQRVERRFGDHLFQQAIDPATGVVSPEQFVKALHKYPPETLNAILGDRAKGFNTLRAKFQAAARGEIDLDNKVQAGAVFREFAGKNPELIVESLAKRPPSDIAAIKEAMAPKDWDALASSWWHDVILNPQSRGGSYGNANVFSRERFLTQLQNAGPERMRLILGDETADYVEKLQRVLQSQETTHRIGANPSGSAHRLIGKEGLTQAAQLGTAIWIGSTAGVTTAGLALVTPALLGQMLIRPRGARLILEAAQAAPGTRAAQEAAKRIAIYAAQQNRQDATREEKE